MALTGGVQVPPPTPQPSGRSTGTRTSVGDTRDVLLPGAFGDDLGSLVAGSAAIEVELGGVAGHSQPAFGTYLPIIPSEREVSPIFDGGRERIALDDSVSLRTLA